MFSQSDVSSLKHQAPKQDAVLVFDLVFEARCGREVADIYERCEGIGRRGELFASECLGADTKGYTRRASE